MSQNLDILLIAFVVLFLYFDSPLKKFVVSCLSKYLQIISYETEAGNKRNEKIRICKELIKVFEDDVRESLILQNMDKEDEKNKISRIVSRKFKKFRSVCGSAFKGMFKRAKSNN